MGARTWIVVASLATIVVVAGALALWSLDDARPASSSVPADLEALRDELRGEREARQALSRELEALRVAVERLTGERSAPQPFAQAPAPQAPAVGTAPAAAEEGGEESEENGGAELGTTIRADRWFDGEALVALGVPADEVERLRELYENNQLDILYLRDQAAREGWMNSPRFRQEMRDLRGAVEGQLDQGQYDMLLYATGRPNRVVLQGVLSNSPAQRAGLRDGDVILRYGEQTIFNARDLSRATTSGRAGSTVPLEVLRDGQVQSFYLPRGPLGARLRVESRPPDTGW